MRLGVRDRTAQFLGGGAFIFLALFLAFLGPGQRSASSSPLSQVQSELLGTFRNTYYYIVLESDFTEHPTEVPILTLKGDILAQVSRAFKSALDIEGSGKLLDGRVINYAGIKDHEIRYQVTSHSFGDGVGNCELRPFHTIAVDPERIPLGSLVQIDETIGMILPDGSIHDGLWRAEDVGGAIKKDRIDLFVGTAAWGHALAKNGITHLQPLTIRMVQSPDASSCVHHALLDAAE